MKNLIVMFVTLCGAMCFGASTDTQYKVYDVVMSLTTSKAVDTASSSCSDGYVYRKKATRKVQGVIAGCGCIAASGDPSCDNFVMYFWDATTKTPITNYTFTTEILQRIGKTGNEVEQVVFFKVDEQADEMFDLTLAGFGTYKESKSGAKYDVINTKGSVTGIKDAPYLVTIGSCSACTSTPDTIDQSSALPVCDDNGCTKSEDSATTPVYGTYTFKFNSSKAKKCEKKGVSAEVLGVPVYAR